MLKQSIWAALRAAILAGAVAVCTAVGNPAVASQFDGWTVRQIKAHPDFVADAHALSKAMNHGGPDARRVYSWIGYIPVGDTRVYFTSFGEPLTCVRWERTGEWVPQWVHAALESLAEEGYIKLNGEALNNQEAPPETITVEGRG